MRHSHVLMTIPTTEIKIGDYIPSEISTDYWYEIVSCTIARHEVILIARDSREGKDSTNDFRIVWPKNAERNIYVKING